jgi:peptidyl-tRNA hydrolase
LAQVAATARAAGLATEVIRERGRTQLVRHGYLLRDRYADSALVDAVTGVLALL